MLTVKQIVDIFKGFGCECGYDKGQIEYTAEHLAGVPVVEIENFYREGGQYLIKLSRPLKVSETGNMFAILNRRQEFWPGDGDTEYYISY